MGKTFEEHEEYQRIEFGTRVEHVKVKQKSYTSFSKAFYDCKLSLWDCLFLRPFAIKDVYTLRKKVKNLWQTRNIECLKTFLVSAQINDEVEMFQNDIFLPKSEELEKKLYEIGFIKFDLLHEVEVLQCVCNDDFVKGQFQHFFNIWYHEDMNIALRVCKQKDFLGQIQYAKRVAEEMKKETDSDSTSRNVFFHVINQL